MRTPDEKVPVLDLNRVLAVKKASQARLLAIPGVNAVGVGGKIVGGRSTAEPAIMVFLTEKKGLADLAPHEVVPADIEGVKTDVVELGAPHTLAARHEDPDEHSYWSTFGLSIDVQGGIQIRAANGAEFGTVGCIAHTKDQPPKRVALTCHHVVAALRGLVTDLTVEVSPDQRTFKFKGGNTPGSLAVALLSVRPDGSETDEILDAFWQTTSADTLATITQNVAAAITGMGHAGVKAEPKPEGVRIIPQPGFTVTSATCQVFDPHRADSSQLSASIAGNVITLDGQVSGDYGIYTSLNAGGADRSRGVFTAVAKGTSLDSVASKIADSISSGITHKGAPEISAAAIGNQVTLTVTLAGVPKPVQEVECDIRSDLRVGQPSDGFCCRCCPCCNDRIGRILDARLDVDVALVELDSGIGSKPEIVDIGAVKGTRSASDPDIAGQIAAGTYSVKKRGRNTRLTKGKIVALDFTGQVITIVPRKNGTKSNVFHHQYRNAILIRPDDTEEFIIDGVNLKVFARGGDSGAALVDNDNKIMGIVFGGATANNGDLWAVATPIEDITSAFDIVIDTAPAAQPPAAPQPQAVVPESLPGVGGATPASGSAPNLRERLDEMEREVTSTPAGRKYSELVRRHFPEALNLVNTNRRVATIWHRSGGPRIVQSLMQILQSPNQTLPPEIDGKPLRDCLLRIQKIFMRYGSRAFSADLERFGPSLVPLAGLPYREALTALQALSPE